MSAGILFVASSLSLSEKCQWRLGVVMDGALSQDEASDTERRRRRRRDISSVSVLALWAKMSLYCRLILN